MRDDISAYDPTRIREQRSLSNSTGTIWLVVGGLFTLISAVLFVLLASLEPALAFTGLAIVLVLYVVMIAVRLVVPEGRRRLALMAACMLATAATALVLIAIIAGTQWESIGS